MANPATCTTLIAQTIITHHDHAHGGHHHADAQDIHGISLTADRPIDGQKFTAWLDRLLADQGPDILRAKGIIDVQGEDRRLVFQAVHMILEGDLQRAWGENERRWSRTRCSSAATSTKRSCARAFEACIAQRRRMNFFLRRLSWSRCCFKRTAMPSSRSATARCGSTPVKQSRRIRIQACSAPHSIPRAKAS